MGHCKDEHTFQQETKHFLKPYFVHSYDFFRNVLVRILNFLNILVENQLIFHHQDFGQVAGNSWEIKSCWILTIYAKIPTVVQFLIDLLVLSLQEFWNI